MKRTGTLLGARSLLSGWICIVSVSGICISLAGCERPSPEKIEAWKQTERGPAKLKAVLADRGVEVGLRTLAALALCEIGKLDDVVATVATLAEEDRSAFFRSAVPAISSRTKGAEGRDILFALRPSAPAAERIALDDALLASIERDLRLGRAENGRATVPAMIEAIGAAAAPRLLGLIDEPAAPLPLIVESLAKVGDAAIKAKAAADLTKRASAARQPQDHVYRALAALGGQEPLAFLHAKILGADEESALVAAKALQTRHEPADLEFALFAAANPKTNRAVRDEMFGICERNGGPAVQAGLVRIIATDAEEVVRYRAFEAALLAGKSAAALPALEAFPATANYKSADVIDYLVKDVQNLGAASVRPLLPSLLASRAPLARLVGVLVYESVGTAADAPSLLKLTADKGTVKGFSPGSTIGKEATRVAGALKNKRT